jgi:hypothetical protein
VATKPCIYCKSPLEDGAILCPTCKYHQANWRNNLTFTAGLAGFVALVGSAITFIYVNAYDFVHKYTATDKIDAIYLAYTGLEIISNARLLVSNHGDGDLFLSDIFIEI